MFTRRLKVNIILNLLLVLSASMLLIDLVMVGALRQELLRSRQDEGLSLLTAGEAIINEDLTYGGLFDSKLEVLLGEASAACLALVDVRGKDVVRAGRDCELIGLLRNEAVSAVSSGKPSSSFAGVIRGIIWPDHKTLLVSRPYYREGKIAGALAVSLDLEGLYQALRSSQRIFLGYFAVNLLVFTLVGFYQLYRRLLKPINRLVETAEEFRDDEDFTFIPEKKSGEFNRLYHSLNKMLARISRDRDRLRETILDLEEANLKLRNTQQEMVRAEKLASVGRLSAGIAHEIGNPIGIAIGFLDLLKKGPVPEEQQKDFIRRVDNEINRVNTIIRQLLDFARQPSDEGQGEVFVHDVIKEVVEICRVQPMMTGTEIIVDEQAGDDRVTGSGGQLRQVFLNLLINAADAINTADERDYTGQISIGTMNPNREGGGVASGKTIIIRVADNGPGIAAENIENIFDPFYTTKEPGKGTGLGLSICFTIIENMGGFIEAVSEGEGTTFTITLPLAKSSSTIKE